MTFLLALLLQAAAAGAPPQVITGSTELIGCVPGTRLFARLNVPAFATEDRHAQILKQALGPRAIFVGTLPAQEASLELVVDSEAGKQHLTDAEWRDFNLKDSGSQWKYFDAAGLLGGEASLFFEGSGTHEFHAFAVRGGHRIDLHLSETWDTQRKPRLTRTQFIELAATFRLALLRVGPWNEMPPRAIELMDQALARGATWRTYLDDLAKTTPDDAMIPFAAAEVGRFVGGEEAKPIEDYGKSIALLAKEKDPTAGDRLVHVACEHGLATLYLEKKAPEEVALHFDAAQKASADLSPGVRATVLYDRACAEGRLGRPEAALEWLKEAERIKPGALQLALHEKDLAAVRELKWFKDFLEGDRGNR